MFRTLLSLALLSILRAVQAAVPAYAAVAGDCDGDGWVNFQERVAIAKRIVGQDVSIECSVPDSDGDGELSVADLVGVLVMAPASPPTVTPTSTPTRSATATLSFTHTVPAPTFTVSPTPTATQRQTPTPIKTALGSGQFGTPIALPCGVYPIDVTQSDLNEDGHADFIVANRESKNLHVRFGHGDGTFDPPLVVELRQAPKTVVAADVDGDGHVDLLVPNDVWLTLIRGHGDGTFEARVDVAEYPTIQDLGVADVDGDGILDLLATVSQGFIFKLGIGGGTFGATTSLPSSRYSTRLSIGDFNGDSFPDVVAGTTAAASRLLISLGTGSGLGPVSQIEVSDSFPIPEAADLDEDGDIDILVSGANLLVNDGNGNFTPSAQGFNQSGVTLVVDADNDGHVDVLSLVNLFDLALNHFISILEVRRGLGSGAFSERREFRIEVPAPTGNTTTNGGLAVADFNEDGVPDVIAAPGFTKTENVWLLLGESAGS